MSQVTVSPLQEFADHVFNLDNVWNPENFIQSKTINGVIDRHGETSLRMQYCHGNSYCEGFIGDQRIRIFGSYLQGYQVWIYDSADDPTLVFEANTPLRIHPGCKETFVESVLSNL